MSVFEHIEDTLKRIEQLGSIHQSKSKFIYVNKKDKTDTFETLQEALDRQLNLADYKKKSLFEQHKEAIVEILTEKKGSEISSLDVSRVNYFLSICKMYSKVEDFQTELKSINAKILKAKDEKIRKELKIKRIFLYIKFEVKPQKSFADIELYQKLHKEYIEKVNEEIDKI